MKRSFQWSSNVMWVLSVVCLISVPSPAAGDVRLPHVIGSNMVLQREKPLPVWGWADAGEQVTVTLAGQTETTQADADGTWRLTLDALKTGGPLTLTVAGKNTITLENILVGEVWVCSGQSNMKWPMSRAEDAQAEIAAANFPKIRLFNVPQKPLRKPADDVQATWQACTPETVPSFSAVAYFFGRHLHRELDVPIGLVETAWGGTRIEPWTPTVGFRAVPKLKTIAQQAASLQKGDGKKPVNRQSPTVLYNGMVHGLAPFAIRGTIWYQGEANRADGMLYHHKMKALITGWRTVWDQGDFPFLFVQLAPFRYGGDPTMLPRLWEAQAATLSVPNTGMAVTTDIGNVKDIHPRNKQDVGKRLALWALAETYGQEDLVYSGPLYKSMSVEDSRIRITFDHTAGGLTTRDGKAPDWFTIAGEDRKFVEAQAEIDGETVVVSSEQVSKPAAVRFGWHQEAEPNLANKAGLPASPFRTDRWEKEPGS